jgi:hypothetical protein
LTTIVINAMLRVAFYERILSFESKIQFKKLTEIGDDNPDFGENRRIVIVPATSWLSYSFFLFAFISLILFEHLNSK